MIVAIGDYCWNLFLPELRHPLTRLFWHHTPFLLSHNSSLQETAVDRVYTSFCLDYVISVWVSNQLCESHTGLTLPPAAWLVLEKLQEQLLFCFVFVKIFLVFPYSIFSEWKALFSLVSPKQHKVLLSSQRRDKIQLNRFSQILLFIQIFLFDRWFHRTNIVVCFSGWHSTPPTWACLALPPGFLMGYLHVGIMNDELLSQ